MSDMLTSALQYRDRGFAVHWLRPQSKAPISAKWSTASVATAAELSATYRSGFNVGFRAGTPSTIDGKVLCVLDIDVRGGAAYQQEALEAADKLFGEAIKYDLISGSQVGRHKYLLFPVGRAPTKAATTLVQSSVFVDPTGAPCAPGAKHAKRAWLVEILSSGKNVVLPPSVHDITGKQYVALHASTKIDDAPAAFIERIDQLYAAPDWGPPDNFGHDLSPVGKITPDMLPEPLRAWCVDIAHRMQCPLEFVAVAAVSVFGSIIGTGCGIRPKQLDDWTEVANLWGAIIARPGRLKTPAINQALRPLHALERAAEQDHQAELRAYMLRETGRKIQADLAKAKAKSQPATMKDAERDALISEAARLSTSSEDEPTPRRYLVNDSTPEKLGDNIAKNPRGLLVLRDELMGLLESFEKQGHEGEQSFYLEAWGGLGSYRVDRIGRGSQQIRPFCATVFGGIQPQKIENYIWRMQSAGNNGFVQRFQLLVYPDDQADAPYVDQRPDEAASDAVEALAIRLAHCNFAEFGAKADYADAVPYLRFEPTQAQPVFVKWLAQLELQIKQEDSPLMAEHFSKYRKLVPGLALIFHLVAAASNPASLPAPAKRRKKTSPAVGEASLHLALRWATVLESHARRVYGMATDYRVQAAKCLAKKIAAGDLDNGFGARDVNRKGWTNLTDPDLVKQACDELVAAHWLRRAERPAAGRGRPADPRYEINPAARTNPPELPTKPTQLHRRARRVPGTN